MKVHSLTLELYFTARSCPWLFKQRRDSISISDTKSTNNKADIHIFDFVNVHNTAESYILHNLVELPTTEQQHHVPNHSSRSVIMATACVFQINELLEMILINTSAVDCTRFQRVNSTWHTAITNSPPIRRTIFLDPESSFHTHQPVEATEYSDRGCMRPAQAISRIHPALGTIHTRGTVLGAAIIKA